MRFALCCDAESLDISGSGTIWGGVWIEAGAEAFPQSGWNDMAVAFAAELGTALIGVRESGPSSKSVRFYDGPFRVTVEGSMAGQLVLTLEGSGKNMAMTLPAVQVVNSFISTTSGLLRACQVRGWGGNPDVIRLAGVVASLDR